MVLKSFASIVILSAYKNVLLPFWLRPGGKYGDGWDLFQPIFAERHKHKDSYWVQARRNGLFAIKKRHAGAILIAKVFIGMLIIGLVGGFMFLTFTLLFVECHQYI